MQTKQRTVSAVRTPIPRTPSEQITVDMAEFAFMGGNIIKGHKSDFLTLSILERERLRKLALQASFASSVMLSWLDGIFASEGENTWR